MYKPDSEISRVARGASPESPEVREILARCEELRAQTNGYFDAYAGGTLDPSGLVKGWAVDRAADLLDAAGICEYVVNAGGDMRVRGTWRVGIQHPLEPQAVAAVVQATDLALATSAEYARPARARSAHRRTAPRHPLRDDQRSGSRDRGRLRDSRLCNGRARRTPWVARLRDYGALLILDDERVLSRPSFGCAPR
jgi:thiamine biosynthesis lipoprotein